MNYPYYGVLFDLSTGMMVTSLIALFFVLGFAGAPLWLWCLAGAAALYGLGAPIWALGVFVGVSLLVVVPPIRRTLVSGPVLNLMDSMGFLPSISETEKIALEAGDVWMEEELFSGRPDFDRIWQEDYPELSDREREFLEGPAEELCRMVDDWDVWSERRLPDEAWDHILENRFFGMIIPEEYGGLDFSPVGTSAVIQKVGTSSSILAITIMVPNSLGPGELLSFYGTEEQKDYYLPKLARGEEIPCFGLTEPKAGSDAGSLTSRGELFEEDGDLKIRLNWEKRWITLAPIATTIGLAFRLYDPENHLGQGEDVGITCALVPSDLEGVENDAYHDPLGVPFYNGPTRGEDVVISADQIIGGTDWAGRGWQMLMEALAAGRGISIPAHTAGLAKFASRVTSAHGVVRRQFGLPIGKFEGVEEPLSSIGGKSYIMESTRRFTCASVQDEQKPTVASAITKYHMSEMGREVVNDAMDIRGGSAITRGPNNLLAHEYTGAPISITVEGANIMTRTLIIFGQGSIRCHPYLLEEMMGMMEGDVKRFDRAFCGHIGHIVRNGFRTVAMSLTRGWASLFNTTTPTSRYWRHLEWASTSFAFLADLALTTMGGALKRKEKISGRFADVFSWMYMATAVLRRFEEEGEREEDRPFFEWSMDYAFYRMQEAFEGLYENFELPLLTPVLRYLVAPWVRLNSFGSPPDDRLGHEVARRMQTPGEDRRFRTRGIFEPEDEEDPFYRLEEAFRLSVKGDEVIGLVKDAMKDGTLERGEPREALDEAVEAGVITEDERETVRRARKLRDEVIQVDEFPFEQYESASSLRRPSDSEPSPGAPSIGSDGTNGAEADTSPSTDRTEDPSEVS